VEQAAQLADEHASRTPAELLATRDPTPNTPGLYSWWVDNEGASRLTVSDVVCDFFTQ
jgi:hypothetical protein